jgi:beta,beta-carotene 9',10'-dioxygenase
VEETGLTRRTLLGAAAASVVGVPLARAATPAAADHRLGFADVEHELSIGRLDVDGRLPGWLSGTLVRNGPGRYEVGERTFEHWFDGLAMLHAFGFARGQVSYRNRFLRSSAYEAAEREGLIKFNEFATDPCRAIFNGAQASFQIAPLPNANVNIGRLADDFVAMTELPLPVKFDPATLRTVGGAGPPLTLGQVGTAHPHRTTSGRRIDYEIELVPPSAYVVRSGGRELARIPAARPAYMHSFALTQRYVVLAESPFTVDPLKLVTDWEPFIKNYRWNASEPTRLHVVALDTGRHVATLETDPYFTFHHVNAYDDGDRVVVDALAYPDHTVIDALYLKSLRGNGLRRIPSPRPLRLELDLARKRVRRRELWDGNLELPRIAYGQVNARDYRYVYGCSLRDPSRSRFLDQLVKLDVRSGDARIWRERGCFPGEAVFVRAPDAKREDDGVALSVVLDTRRRTSFLLVLDARTFTERARAEVPQPVPFGFHGEVFA